MQGKIIKGIAGFYYVHTESGNVYECKAKGVFRKDKQKPLVGDNVELDILDEEKKLSKVTEIPSNEANARKKLVISDVHVFGERIYYFCSDGKAGGDRAFFEYNMNTSETNKIFES